MSSPYIEMDTAIDKSDDNTVSGDEVYLMWVMVVLVLSRGSNLTHCQFDGTGNELHDGCNSDQSEDGYLYKDCPLIKSGYQSCFWL